MAINYPTTLDTLTNPTGTDSVATVDHASQHSNVNDISEALQAKVGVDSSAVTTSHDYKLGEVTSSDKAVGKTATQTLTNKTLTSPTIAVIDNSGDLTLPSGAETLVGRATTDTLTNKTATATTNNIAAKSLHSATTVVDVVSGAAPTSGQVLTATGDSAATWQAVTTGTSTATQLPRPVAPLASTGDPSQQITMDTNTVGNIGQIIIPFDIVANKITIRTGTTVTTAGTLDLTLYAEDGQSQIFSVTTASLSSTSTLYTTALSAVSIPAGIYYLMANTNGTADLTVLAWFTDGDVPFGGTEGFLEDVSSEPVIQGTATITASTPPATFTPASSITGAISTVLTHRFDN